MVAPAPWIVANRYEVGAVIGQGGYGMVCRGVDQRTGEPVALKMLSSAASSDPNVVERMRREQQAMLALQGTCAVTALDLCRLDNGAPCLVMEWLEGVDLERQLSGCEAAGERLKPEWLLETLLPIAETLNRAHELGIAHRDIKPANIFLTPNSEQPVRLLDFGLSRMKSASRITATDMVLGSPSYIAPETWRGDSSLIDGRSDLYSLAVIVFRVLTGKLPFDTPSLVERLELVTRAERPSVTALCAELPPAIDVWMRRALAIEPDERFQTGLEFHAELARAIDPHRVRGTESSGIRALAAGLSAASAAPRRRLSAAWGAATSLMRRFTVARSSQPAPPAPTAPSSPPPSSPSPSRAHTPPPPRPRTPPPARPSPTVREAASVWLDDADLEERGPESLAAARPQPPPADVGSALLPEGAPASEERPVAFTGELALEPKVSRGQAGDGPKKQKKRKKQRKRRKG